MDKFEARDGSLPSSSRTDISTLWYTRCPVPTASSVAVHLGLLTREFEADGIAVRSLRASAERGVRESHFDHSQANSFREGGNTPPLWNCAKRADIVIIGLTWVDEYQAILALPESGIRTVEDLRGRRVGVPVRTSDQIDFFRGMAVRGYLSAMRTVGLGRDEVEFVEIPVTESYLGDATVSNDGQLWSGGNRARRQQADAFALIRGQVDAIYTSGAAGLQLGAFLGAHEVMEFGFHPDPEVRGGNEQPVVLSASAALVRERPDLAARYLRQVLNAAEWAESHREETIQLFANEIGTSFEWADAAYGPDVHRKLRPSLDEELVSALDVQKAFLLEHGFLPADFPLDSVIERTPLELALARAFTA
ncbi:MAG: ABC transporter substrate-binding protein [Aquisalimonadaceae bacterium]